MQRPSSRNFDTMKQETAYPEIRILRNAGTSRIVPLLCLPEYSFVILRGRMPESATIYGRRYYDFAEGTLNCHAPGKFPAASFLRSVPPAEWLLAFRVDLVRRRITDDYPFFAFFRNEALHLSAREKRTLSRSMEDIEQELRRGPDLHSRPLLSGLVECLLDLCARYYDRQFCTRQPAHEPLLQQYASDLSAYIDSGQLQSQGFPTAGYFSERLGLSPAYFSCLLEHETGRDLKTDIELERMEVAKYKLSHTQLPVSLIAETLGFPSPQLFCSLFKKLTGLSPGDYRIRN